MKIARCQRCGRIILFYGNCYFCKNSVDFEFLANELQNAETSTDIALMESYVQKKKFEEALELSNGLLEKSPTCSAIYWLRLIAQNKLSLDAGISELEYSFADDPNFINALRHSTGLEHQAYDELKKELEKKKQFVINELKRRKKEAISSTNIVSYRKELSETISEKQDIVFSLWRDLSRCEDELLSVVLKQKILQSAFSGELTMAVEESKKICNQTYSECSEEVARSMQNKIRKVAELSNRAKDELETLAKSETSSEHIKQYTAQQDDLLSKIAEETASLDKLMIAAKATINNIRSIQQRYNQAIADAENNDYSAAYVMIGADVLQRLVLQNMLKA